MKKQTTELVNFEFNDATAMRPRSVWCCWDGSGPKERAESTQRTAESTGQHKKTAPGGLLCAPGGSLARLAPIGAVLCRAGLPAWAVVGRARWAC